MIESSSNKVFGSDDSERSFRDYDGHEFTEDELSKNIDLCLGEVDKITWQSNEPPSSSDIVEPCIGMEFNSRDHAREFYIAYGRHTGFTVRIHHNRRSRVNNMVIGQDFVCSKEGFREKKYIYRKDRVLPPPPATREGCPAMLRLTLRDGVKWVVTKFIKEHNHTLMSPSKVPWRGSAKNFISEVGFLSHHIHGSTFDISLYILSCFRVHLLLERFCYGPGLRIWLWVFWVRVWMVFEWVGWGFSFCDL